MVYQSSFLYLMNSFRKHVIQLKPAFQLQTLRLCDREMDLVFKMETYAAKIKKDEKKNLKIIVRSEL